MHSWTFLCMEPNNVLWHPRPRVGDTSRSSLFPSVNAIFNWRPIISHTWWVGQSLENRIGQGNTLAHLPKLSGWNEKCVTGSHSSKKMALGLRWRYCRRWYCRAPSTGLHTVNAPVNRTRDVRLFELMAIYTIILRWRAVCPSIMVTPSAQWPGLHHTLTRRLSLLRQKRDPSLNTSDSFGTPRISAVTPLKTCLWPALSKGHLGTKPAINHRETLLIDISAVQAYCAARKIVPLEARRWDTPWHRNRRLLLFKLVCRVIWLIKYKTNFNYTDKRPRAM